MLKNLYQKIIISLSAGLIAIPQAGAVTFSHESRLSQGHWVKVKVTENGMQQLTFDQLRELGFADPSKVAVYGYPSWKLATYQFNSSIPDDLPAVPVAVYGDKLVFYGEGNLHPYDYLSGSVIYAGLKRNLAGMESYYYLTDSQPRANVPVFQATPSQDLSVVSEARGYCLKDFRERYPHQAGVGAYLVGENYAYEGGGMDLILPEYYREGAYPISVNAGITTYTPTKGTADKFTISLADCNTQTLQPKLSYGNNGIVTYLYNNYTFSLTKMTERGDDTYPLSIEYKNPADTRQELSFDYFALSYPRLTLPRPGEQDFMSFPDIKEQQGVFLPGSTENTRVWNVTNPASPTEMTITDVEDDRGIVADRAYRLTVTGDAMQIVTFDPASTLHQPEIVGVVENQNLHALDVPEMVIVSAPGNLSQAHRLAQLHSLYTGTDVAVVDYNDVCNEFGSGSRHPMALRRFVKMMYDRDPDRFKALLIFGRAARDNTGMTLAETPEQIAQLYVPMLQCEDQTILQNGGQYNICGAIPTSYGTDAIYGILKGEPAFNNGASPDFYKGKYDIMVGRIPASDLGEAKDYVDKVEKYLGAPSDKPLYNNALVMPDYGDDNKHLSQGLAIRNLIAKYSPSTMTNLAAISATNRLVNGVSVIQNQIKSALTRGCALWSYMGHSGASTTLSNTWGMPQDKALINDAPPFTIFATCQTLVMDDGRPDLQSQMLFNKEGGMIAGLGSIRSVFAEYNDVATRIGIYGYYTRKPGATFGEIYKEGRNMMIDNPNEFYPGLSLPQYINTLCFNFAGDPMLPVHMPDGVVKITKINGEAPPESMVFNPLEKQNFEGYVYTADGEVDTDFNGKLTIQVYDGNYTVNTAVSLAVDDTNPAIDVEFDDCLLQQVTCEVKDGYFSGELTFAAPVHEGDRNRVNLFAQTADRKRTSVGTLDNVKISQTLPDDVEQAVGPSIDSFYAVSPEFVDGDCLPADFVVYANVTAGDFGLIGASDHIGGAMSLVLDNSRRYGNVDSFFTKDADGNGLLAMPLTDLMDGPHQLTFSVADIAGTTVNRTINFNVSNVTEGVLKLENEFVKDEVVMDVDHGHALETTGRVVITNPAGKVVYTNENTSFPFTWDVKDNAGQPLASGIYAAKVYFKAERRYGYTNPVRIIVGK